VVMAGERELFSNGVQKEGVIACKSHLHAGVSTYFSYCYGYQVKVRERRRER
jgi:hypothetical protein